MTFRGTIQHRHGHPKDGMVYDFSAIKEIIERNILSQFDHCLVLSNKEDHETVTKLSQRYEKLVLLNDEPTCENLLVDFIRLIQNDIPDELELVAVRLDETANSYAEWRIEDQLRSAIERLKTDMMSKDHAVKVDTSPLCHAPRLHLRGLIGNTPMIRIYYLYNGHVHSTCFKAPRAWMNRLL